MRDFPLEERVGIRVCWMGAKIHPVTQEVLGRQ